MRINLEEKEEALQEKVRFREEASVELESEKEKIDQVIEFTCTYIIRGTGVRPICRNRGIVQPPEHV